ncbi:MULTISPECIES: hypothetical protein [Streptomyces]|uniref:hypothetical protein n=1 Tax=Streptomyces TaxID=1883 RepID=UPI00345C1FBB
MRSAAALWLSQRLGRRGVFLLLIGVGKVCWGVGYIATPQPPSPGLQLLTDIAPMHCWAMVWVLAGFVTAGAAFVQVGRDWAGFAAALVPPTVWATAYMVAAVSGGYGRGAFVAIWYLASHIGVILWASGVPEYAVPCRGGKGTG